MNLAKFKPFLPVGILVLILLTAMLLKTPAPAADTPAATGPSMLPAGGEQPAPADSAPPPNEFMFDSFWLIVKMILILGAVCILAWLSLRWLLPRIYGNRGEPGGRISVLESYRLEPRRMLYLVKADGQHLLVASSERGVHLLTRLDQSGPPPAPPSIPSATAQPDQTPAFREILERKR